MATRLVAHRNVVALAPNSRRDPSLDIRRGTARTLELERREQAAHGIPADAAAPFALAEASLAFNVAPSFEPPCDEQRRPGYT